MRILFICKCSPLMEGGAETRTKEVAFRAAKLGHEVTIYCGKTNIAEQEEVVVNQVKVIHKKVMPGLAGSAMPLSKLCIQWRRPLCFSSSQFSLF